MSKEEMGSKSMGKFVKVFLIADLCIWIHFWITFEYTSYPYRPDPLGHPAGTGYTFWGHSIAVVESGFAYSFFKIVFCSELPSFVSAILITRVFDPRLASRSFWFGISEGGWILLGAMLLSFFQWYLIGRIAQGLWRRCAVATLKPNRQAGVGPSS
jgi:hypothetical protein